MMIPSALQQNYATQRKSLTKNGGLMVSTVHDDDILRMARTKEELVKLATKLFHAAREHRRCIYQSINYRKRPLIIYLSIKKVKYRKMWVLQFHDARNNVDHTYSISPEFSQELRDIFFMDPEKSVRIKNRYAPHVIHTYVMPIHE